MEQYTVLLVDDEEEAIQVIMKKINWEALGFSVVGCAGNGVKALEIMEEVQPDVVMTDIKMPYMDGMELSHRIMEKYPDTKILLLTGFDEFEYAKEAIRLEIEEYILKPVNSDELSAVFGRLRDKLDQEIRDKQNLETLKNYYLESLPFLQTNFYTMLVEGRIREEELPKYLADYQIQFSGPCYCCLVLYTSGGRHPENMNLLMLGALVRKQAEERLGENWRARSFAYLGNTVMIAQLESEGDGSELTNACERFCKYADRMLGADVTIGVGQVCGQLLDVEQSYLGAREAVSYRALFGGGRAINIGEIAPGKIVTEEQSAEGELAALLKAMRLGTEAETELQVQHFLNQLFLPEKSLQQHHIELMELLSCLYKFSVSNELTVESFAGNMGQVYLKLQEMDEEALRRWLLQLCLTVREQLINARSQSTRSFVHKAQEYVRNNFADESLSLDKICEVLGVSNSYFSSIFKKETGNSFIGYLTNYRMEHAARMLIESNEKSYIIARQVGYADPNYFSYVFKRVYGRSPSKYRSEHSGQAT